VTQQHADGDRRSGDARSCVPRSAAHGQTGSREAVARQVGRLPLSAVRVTPSPSVNGLVALHPHAVACISASAEGRCPESTRGGENKAISAKCN
jgi:hypothetical protein